MTVFIDDTPCWYLVQCKPGESFRAVEHLENQNYTCFHPTYPIKRKLRGLVQTRTEVLFPHYIFILLKKADNWAPIRSTRGVNCLVRFNGVPARLEEHVVEGIRQQCAKLHGIEAESLYKAGDRVLITDTCFKEIEAIVTATRGDERVTLLFNLCNRPQYVDLSVNAVTLVNKG